MSVAQKVIKYCALTLAVLLSVAIIGSIVASVAGLIAFLGSKEKIGEMKIYEITEAISSVKLDIGAAELSVKSGDVFKVESNIEKLTVRQSDGVLTIAEKKHPTLSYSGRATVTVYLPREAVLDSFSLNAGAGTVDIESVSANDVSLDLGAGETSIGRLEALRSAEINGGAGKVSISYGRLNALDADLGVGMIDAVAELSGKCCIKVGVGRAEFVLRGGKDAYCFEVKKGIGSITVDGAELSDGQMLGDGINLIRLDGGVGSITVKFEG